MSTLILSNLRVRPNLLPADDYQQDMMRCSVFELRDIRERNPNLLGLAQLPAEKQKEWRESLFWGDAPPPAVDPRWPEQLAAGMADAIRELEERPTLEAAFELLLIARELYHARAEGPARTIAAEWDRRVCEVLARDEFRHTPDMIDQRLESILGRQVARPCIPKATLLTREPGPGPPDHPLPLLAVPAPLEERRLMSSLEVPPVSATTSNGTSAVTPLPTPLAGRADATAVATPPKPTKTLVVRDPDLKRLVQRWATLPDQVKKCVMKLLDDADAAGTLFAE